MPVGQVVATGIGSPSNIPLFLTLGLGNYAVAPSLLGPSYSSPQVEQPARRRRTAPAEIRSDGAYLSVRIVFSAEGQVEVLPVAPPPPVIVPIKKRQLIVGSASTVSVRVRAWVGRPKVEPQDDPEELKLLGLLD